MADQLCPCGSGKSYEECCEKLHSGQERAASAELLMRARYSAFEKNEIDFIEKTHKPGTTDFDREEAQKWATQSTWLGLDVVKTLKGSESDQEGIVEFKAHYSNEEGNKFQHHEIAKFEKIDGHWFYSDGDVVGLGPLKRTTPKIGRNEPCPCGSGKKYKKCCGR
jgi:SEC-C motif domain protein